MLGRVLQGALASAAGREDIPDPWACSQVCTAGASVGGLGRQVGEEDTQGLGETGGGALLPGPLTPDCGARKILVVICS